MRLNLLRRDDDQLTQQEKRSIESKTTVYCSDRFEKSAIYVDHVEKSWKNDTLQISEVSRGRKMRYENRDQAESEWWLEKLEEMQRSLCDRKIDTSEVEGGNPLNSSQTSTAVWSRDMGNNTRTRGKDRDK